MERILPMKYGLLFVLLTLVYGPATGLSGDSSDPCSHTCEGE